MPGPIRKDRAWFLSPAANVACGSRFETGPPSPALPWRAIGVPVRQTLPAC